ncbi:unnamed protein product, partial [Ectocarpus fasciculatus]
THCFVTGFGRDSAVRHGSGGDGARDIGGRVPEGDFEAPHQELGHAARDRARSCRDCHHVGGQVHQRQELRGGGAIDQELDGQEVWGVVALRHRGGVWVRDHLPATKHDLHLLRPNRGADLQ